jgi:hypothetical protein
MYNLDYQELNDYADAHLGLTWEQGDASEIAFSNLQVENSNERVFVKWVKNTGLTALLPGSVVMVDVANDVTKNVVQATAASRPAGVVSHRLKNSVPAGGKFCMIYKGVCEVLVDAAYAKNAAVGTGALGVATTVADTDQVSAVGRLLVASTGAGLARVKLETELV